MNFPLEWMIFVNIGLIASLLLLVFIGYKSGLLLQLFSLVALIAKIIIASMFSPVLAENIVLYTPNYGELDNTVLADFITKQINTVIWFFILYIVLTILFAFLRPLIKGIGKLPIIGFINRWLGAVFGFIKWGLYTLILILILQTPLIANGNQVISDSWLTHIKKQTPFLFEQLQQVSLANPAISRIFSGELLTQEDIEAIVEWILEQSLNQETIDEIIEGLPSNE